MKVLLAQPYYAADHEQTEACFQREIALLDGCTPDLDVIVFPESCDVPAFAKTKEQFLESVERYNRPLLEKARETAIRCNAVLFINACDTAFTGYRNTTFVFDRRGEIVGRYPKQHLTPGEVSKRELNSGYSFEPSAPYTVEVEGVRYGFLTCYDFYFYEQAGTLAKAGVDVIIGCSHQRTDRYEPIEMMTKFFAYNCNAYVFRASVSMGEDAETGGCSMIVAPTGSVVAALHSEIGTVTAEVDVTQKLYKPAGFGNPSTAHYAYIEKGRRPYKYRPAGPSVVQNDERMPYPRVCAHRGFNTVAPENSMPAFGAAVAMGAEEIEFDVWYTADGELVSIHDGTLDRVSTGSGKVYEHTFQELQALDFGIKRGEAFRGLRILRFADILQKFAGQVIMNIHIKTPDNDCSYDETLLQKMIALIRQYHCEEYIYFMSGNDTVLQQLRETAPDLRRCVGAGKKPWEMVDRAIALGCEKVQLFAPHFDRAMIEKAHQHGIRCNVFYADTTEDTEKYLDMGVDTILTNDYHRIAETVKLYKRKEK